MRLMELNEKIAKVNRFNSTKLPFMNMTLKNMIDNNLTILDDRLVTWFKRQIKQIFQTKKNICNSRAKHRFQIPKPIWLPVNNTLISVVAIRYGFYVTNAIYNCNWNGTISERKHTIDNENQIQELFVLCVITIGVTHERRAQ